MYIIILKTTNRITISELCEQSLYNGITTRFPVQVRVTVLLARKIEYKAQPDLPHGIANNLKHDVALGFERPLNHLLRL
jgi:hypothetical protein